jgi:hypothetical protein
MYQRAQLLVSSRLPTLTQMINLFIQYHYEYLVFEKEMVYEIYRNNYIEVFIE